MSTVVNAWKPSGAGLTPLPPSPDLRPNGPGLNGDPIPFSLGGIQVDGGGDGESDPSPSRLRSIARYQAFSPQALACSDPIPSSFSGSNNGNSSSDFTTTSSSARRQSTNSPHANHEANNRETTTIASSSLGAVAGAQGVAVFRISKPHEPLLMLNHATSNTNSNSRKLVPTAPGSLQNQDHQQPLPSQNQNGGGRPVTALAFQPDATRSLYLAAARGSGVLVWDVSGHSLSPLLGRLAMDASVGGSSGGGPIYASESDLSVTSISWKLSAERDGVPLLVTTTNYSACIWDLRSPVATAKPSVRFGKMRKNGSSSNSNSSVSQYVQVACSRSNECATLDAAGTVRVFDIRMTDQTRYSLSSLATFSAFATRGVGISYLPFVPRGGEQSTAWVTWGLDSPDADAVVKIWSPVGTGSSKVKSDSSAGKASGASLVDDTYWYMDGSPGKISTGVAPYRLIAQCSPPYHLACSRVCPDPVENGIMTIGIMDDNRRANEGWRAELWKIRPPTAVEMQADDGTFGMERVVSFNAGAVHDAGIASALGRNVKIGQLQAAELALTSSTVARLQTTKGDDDSMQDNGKTTLGLALCCLSSKGFVTTHFVSEALPLQATPKWDGIGSSSPQRASLFSNGGRAKVFIDDREGAKDAARLWETQGDRPTWPGNEARSSVERVRSQFQSSPVKPSVGKGAGSQPVKSDGGMLFEMDVPAVAYGTATNERLSGVQMQMGPVDLTSPKAAATAAAMVEETDNAAAHMRDVAAMAERMDNIEIERIPCPRICSAVFGPGVGGLAVFKNGDVKKMWNWYDRASSSRLAVIPSSISAPETSFSDPGSSKGPGSAGDHESELTISIPRDYPRSMKDLMDMTEAAKEAQWGEVNDDGGDESDDEQEQSSGDNFFEYMSTGSISSDSDDNEPIDLANDGGKTTRYESYFGNFRRPLAEPLGGRNKKPEGNEQRSQAIRAGSPLPDKVQVVGPSSDTLAPTVHVTHDFDKLALNNQSAELARDWELGQWQAEVEDKYLLSGESRRSLRPDQHFESKQDGDMLDPPGSPPVQRVLANTGLPSYRRLTTSPQKLNSVPRASSDSMLAPIAPPARNVQIENEQGVHGGEYAVRPNMQESMVFLKKLFSHQQQQEGKAFPNLRSPPDSPAVYQTRGKRVRSLDAMDKLRRQGESNIRLSKSPVSAIDEGRARGQAGGVYALGSGAFGTGVHEDDRKLTQIKTLCSHNADVCEKYGETGKQGVWKLLTQMVDRRLNERPDAFNGWGGKGGGALGVDLVANVMQYYETIGDVQMLATMVCVLSGGRPRHEEDWSDQLHLLPTGHAEKYDTYIRRYSDLLFGWSLLVKRAELNKHLAQRFQENEGTNILNDASSKLQSPGISLVFSCPRCGKDAESGTNICRSCQDFAFRCSVCENGVRGLFMVCDVCGHGGHVRHINSWFDNHAECPSGCGCMCTFTSRQRQRSSLKEATTALGDAAGRPAYVMGD